MRKTFSSRWVICVCIAVMRAGTAFGDFVGGDLSIADHALSGGAEKELVRCIAPYIFTRYEPKSVLIREILRLRSEPALSLSKRRCLWLKIFFQEFI